MAGTGGSPGGASGKIVTALSGSTCTFEEGIGGGIATFGNTTIVIPTITGNFALTADNNVDGTINT